MPALLRAARSPAAAQGNIAKWLKKEGDKVVAGDVLAEIETARRPRSARPAHALTAGPPAQDKATMEMESMEEGYVARILKADGAQNVLVGEVRALAHAPGLGAELTCPSSP